MGSVSDNQARPEASFHSRVRRFRLKAVECLHLADEAQYPETKRIYRQLAVSYEQLATHAESIERHRVDLQRQEKSG